MRKTNPFFAILLVMCIATGCARKAEEKKSIKIGINVWPGYAYAFIAKEKGFFEKNNIEVELILKKEYSEAQKLYINGEVDGIFEVYTDTILHNSEGIPTKVVYVSDYSDTGDVIIGRPEFSSLADLEGKIVSFEGINTFSHMFILSALKKAGLQESVMHFENIPAHNVLTALEEGRIDAGHTWEPTKSQALRKGYKILGKAGNSGIITDVMAFNLKIIQERPDDIKRIVKSILEARDFVYTNRDEALEIMSKAEGMSKEEMSQGISGVHQPDLRENIQAMKKSKETTSLCGSGEIIAEFYLNRGQLSHIPNLDEIIEPRFVNELSRERQGNK